MSYMKGTPTNAVGNKRLLKSYGSGSSGPRQAYASGGAVKHRAMGGPAMDEGMAPAEGMAAKPNLSRPGRKMHGKGGKDAGKKGTNVNVIVMPHAPGAGGPPMGGAPGPVGAPGPPPRSRAGFHVLDPGGLRARSGRGVRPRDGAGPRSGDAGGRAPGPAPLGTTTPGPTPRMIPRSGAETTAR